MKIFYFTGIFILIIFFSLEANQKENRNNRIPDLEEGLYFATNLYISGPFQQMRGKIRDAELLDTVYVRTLRFYNNDISETLLALTFASLPFKSMPLKLPLINIKLEIPLPSPPDSIFDKRLRSLPGRLLFDSSEKGFGDVDKISHFFGNAFLSYNISFFNFSKFMGIFVEMFEAAFKVGGGMDHKDVIVNHLGEFFAQSLHQNKNILPSQILDVYPVLYSIYSF